MCPRRMCRRNCLFLCFLLTVFGGAFFISRQDNQQISHHHHHDDDGVEAKTEGQEGTGDERLAALRGEGPYKAVAKPVLPYTVPAEVDYENMADILPHMWKHAIDSQLPNSCEFITFDHNPNMDLGESMFIFASLYGVARKSKRVPFIDYKMGFPLLQIFQFKFIPAAGKTVDGSFFKYREARGCCRYDASLVNITCATKVILTGYLQSYRYFHNYGHELLSTEFVFQESIGNTCLKKFNDVLVKNQLSTSNCQLVGVHIRHPDELTSRQKKRGHVGANAEYLKRAFTYFTETFGSSKNSCLAFLVTGNEGDKLKELVPNMDSGNDSATGSIVKTIFAQANSEAARLCMLTMCHHSIMTTGPTGWWAAYLAQQRNKGRVVYQKDYAEPNSELAQELDKESYFPESWVGL